MSESTARPPTSDDVTGVLGFLPLISAYFDKARTLMPAEHAESFARHGLTARHGAVCVQLVANPDGSVGDLAVAMGLALSTVSELLGDLDRAGWVHRRLDPANRRRTLVSLTPNRFESMRLYLALRAEPLLTAMDELTPAQRDGFAAGIRAWANHVRDWQPTG